MKSNLHFTICILTFALIVGCAGTNKQIDPQALAVLQQIYEAIHANNPPKPAQTPIPTPVPAPPAPTPPAPTPGPAHELAAINILEQKPFVGQELNEKYWTNLAAYCQAGPTKLIVADLNLIPDQMEQAGFVGRDTIKWYALSRTVGGAGDWSPYGPQGLDSEAKYLKDRQSDIDTWWSRYLERIVKIMIAAPQTTALIIINDEKDHCGRSLGNGTYKQMSAVIDRVSVGETVPD